MTRATHRARWRGPSWTVTVVLLATPLAGWAAGPQEPARALIAPTSAPATAPARQADNPIDQCMADTLAALERGDLPAALDLVYAEPGSELAAFLPAGQRGQMATYRLRQAYARHFPDTPLPHLLLNTTDADFLRVYLERKKSDRPVTIEGATAVTQRYFDVPELMTEDDPDNAAFSGAKLYYRQIDGKWKFDASRTLKLEYRVEFADPNHAPATIGDVVRTLNAFTGVLERSYAALESGELKTPGAFEAYVRGQIAAAVMPLKQRGMMIRLLPKEPGSGER